ncbi:GIY-YIG nuclease family protein [Hymenobacter cheonanensis]|uniref:GIY-YIG nuclease family protein n=1 Tax=Hymenobacter sp. CA2-7 TaxID=3063993 RepID=UPI002712775D|nr:GIY-YIG nuclease family protein [Hymenobacter sp. CA2-7]MDO7888189.1 GIY-YIG nuclease family protein [Hymenobacter sp. CA2-7]
MTRASWIAQQHGRKAVLYVVRVYGPGERFYKVGVTFCLSSRFSRLKTLYRWRTVARYSSYNAGKVYDLEQWLHTHFAHLAYRPTASFSGFTECYSDVAELLAALPSGTFFLKNTETLI